MEKKITALSTFFMSTKMPKPTKKVTPVKSGDMYAKKGLVNKKTSDKIKKRFDSSDSSDSSDEEPVKKPKKKVVESSESSSDEEPIKKSKKSKKQVVSSSESSSDEEPVKSKKKKVVESSDDEPLKKSKKAAVKLITDDEHVEKKPIAHDGLLALGKGLTDLAEQLAVSNANQGKILEMLANIFTKLETRDNKDDRHLIEVINDVVDASNLVTIGNSSGHLTYHFESIADLRSNIGNLAARSNFEKILDEENEENEDEDDIVKTLADPALIED